MKRIHLIILASALLAMPSCTKNFDSINTDPSGFSELDAQYQLTKIQCDMSGDREDVWRYDLGIASPHVQHLCGSWWTQHGGMYQILEKSHWFSHWEATYPRELKNLQDIIDKTKDLPEQSNMNAVARILRVYVYSTLTDMYGDIPYSEAVKGYSDRIFLPKYDKQEDIYKDFFNELDAANTQLNTAGPAVKGDVFFNGSVEKWKKFANSLRLRLGFRLTKINIAEAQKQVEAAISKGVMTTLDDICVMKHLNFNYSAGENRGNGRSQVFKSATVSGGFRLTNTLVNYMVNSNDPRVHIYGGTYVGEAIVGEKGSIDVSSLVPPQGLVYGAMAWNANFGAWGNVVVDGVTYSVAHAYRFLQPSKYVQALDAPFFHMTPAEVEFLLAEAAARGWGGQTNPASHFEKAIQFACEAMRYYATAPTIPQSGIDALKAHYSAAYPADLNGWMKIIHEQMWVNFFLNGTEAFANYRRTGYPALVPFTGVDWYSSGTNGVMPRRFFYPESEADQNPDNYNEAVERLGAGGNSFLNRVWWDKP